MLYSVSGDLRPVRKWASNRKGCTVDSHSEDAWDVKFVADDEDDFVEMCDENDIEYEFLADGTGSLDC